MVCGNLVVAPACIDMLTSEFMELYVVMFLWKYFPGGINIIPQIDSRQPMVKLLTSYACHSGWNDMRLEQ